MFIGYVHENVLIQYSESHRDGMFIEKVSILTLESRRDGMFIQCIS